MTNPFESLSANDPDAKKRQTDHQRQLAEQEQTQLFEKNSQAEITKHDPVITEVLQQLKDAMYPGAIVLGGKNTLEYPGRMSSIFPAEEYWQLGVWRTLSEWSGRGTYSYKAFLPHVTVGLELSVIGEAKSYIGSYHGMITFLNKDLKKVKKTALNKELLIDMLTELHTTSRGAQAVIDHQFRITRALAGLKNSPDFQENVARQTNVADPGWLNAVLEDPRLDPVSNLSGNESSIGQWTLSQNDGDGGTTLYVSISLLVDANDVPTNYKCFIRDIEQPLLVPLDDKKLLAMLEQSFLGQKTQSIEKKPKRKSWFGF